LGLGPIVYADLTGFEEAEAQRRLLERVKSLPETKLLI